MPQFVQLMKQETLQVGDSLHRRFSVRMSAYSMLYSVGEVRRRC
jgi:hypothetical protein